MRRLGPTGNKVDACGVGLLVLAFAASARAEISPVEYRKMQDAAPEALDLRVTKVVTEKHKDGRLVSVSATVTAVRRTANGLKAGDTVRIRYVVPPTAATPVVGIGPVPVLDEGETAVAYLLRDGTLYRPAARGQSFTDRRAAETKPASRPGATSGPGA